MKRLILCAVVVANFAQMGICSQFNAKSPLGINLTGVIDHASEIVFLDHMKRSRAWVSQCNTCDWDKGPALDLDQNGWVKSLKSGQFADMVLATAPKYLAGQYKVYFDGEGRMEGRFMTSGVVTKSGDVITMGNSSQKYQVLSLKQTNASNYIRNIRIIKVDEQSLYDGGLRFAPSFLNKWKHYRTFRFMDWGATNNSVLKTFADLPSSDYYSCSTEKGVPIETMVELCNQLDVYPWFCMPHQFSDNDIRLYAQKVKSLLKSHLRVYVEHSNEVWNGDFDQYGWIDKKAQTMGYGQKTPFGNHVLYHGSRSARIAQIWKEVFGNEDRIIGVLAVGGPKAWMADQGMIRAKAEGTARYINAIAIAPYVGSGENYTTEAAALKVLNDGLPEYRTSLRDVKAICDKYSISMISYEGGQHLWAFGDKFSEIGETVQGNAGMYDWVKKYMAIWKEEGGKEYTVFASGGGFWGQIPWGVEPMQAPKYKAHYEFIQENPIWWSAPVFEPNNVIRSAAMFDARINKGKSKFYSIDGKLIRTNRVSTTPRLIIEKNRGINKVRLFTK